MFISCHVTGALQDFDSLNIENESGNIQTIQQATADQAVATSAPQAADNSGQNPMFQGGMQNWNTLLNDQMMAEMEKVMQEIIGTEEGKKMVSNLQGMANLSGKFLTNNHVDRIKVTIPSLHSVNFIDTVLRNTYFNKIGTPQWIIHICIHA